MQRGAPGRLTSPRTGQRTAHGAQSRRYIAPRCTASHTARPAILERVPSLHPPLLHLVQALNTTKSRISNNRCPVEMRIPLKRSRKQVVFVPYRGRGGVYKLEFLQFKLCTKILYAICSVFFRICAGNPSKRPLFLMSNYWEPYTICSLISKKWHRFCRARITSICRFIFSPARNTSSPPPPGYERWRVMATGRQAMMAVLVLPCPMVKRFPQPPPPHTKAKAWSQRHHKCRAGPLPR